MTSVVRLLIVLFTCLLQYSVGISKSGGHPKFPHQVCAGRSVNWNPERMPKVIGGEEPPLGAIPWVVNLQNEGGHFCGGVLISTKLVLTVAHCYKEGLRVRAGAVTSEPSPHDQFAKVKKGIVHPEYRKHGVYSNDIALLLLDQPLEQTPYVKTACFSNESPPPGTLCEVSGWGAYDMNRQKVSPILKTAVVPLLSLQVCREDRVYGNRQYSILDSMLCAGSLAGGTDACVGDSGGPLMCYFENKFVLTGLVSWGDGCAKKHRPGVYTRVASYEEWIYEAAEELGETI